MKKRKILLLLMCLIICFGPLSVLAESPIKAMLDGMEIAFDQPPAIENGRTLAPARAILEALGLSLDFDSDTGTVTAKNDTITIIMTLGSDIALVNGAEQKLDVPAKSINGRTMVPVRFIGEAMDLRVGWDGENRIIYLNSQAYAKTLDNRLANAVEANNAELAKSLILSGANPNAMFMTETGEAPLILIAYKNFEMVKMLVENGADINVGATITTSITSEAFTGKVFLIDMAISQQDMNLLHYILSKNVNLSQKNLYGYTPLEFTQAMLGDSTIDFATYEFYDNAKKAIEAKMQNGNASMFVLVPTTEASPAATPTPIKTPFYFRTTTWGMTQEQVIDTEGSEATRLDDRALSYTNKRVAGLEATTLFEFDENGELYRGSYFVNEPTIGTNNCVNNYEYILYKLKDQYGDPVLLEDIWTNDLFKSDFNRYGLAVAAGHLSCLAIWERGDTAIKVYLRGKNYEIQLTIIYEDKGRADKVPTGDSGL